MQTLMYDSDTITDIQLCVSYSYTLSLFVIDTAPVMFAWYFEPRASTLNSYKKTTKTTNDV